MPPFEVARKGALGFSVSSQSPEISSERVERVCQRGEYAGLDVVFGIVDVPGSSPCAAASPTARLAAYPVRTAVCGGILSSHPGNSHHLFVNISSTSSLLLLYSTHTVVCPLVVACSTVGFLSVHMYDNS